MEMILIVNRSPHLLLAIAFFALLLINVNSQAQSSDNNIVADTFWAGIDSDGSPFVFEFQKSGRFKYTPSTGILSKGKWRLKENSIAIEINEGFVKIKGRVENGRMEGEALSRLGHRWKWSATKQPVIIANAAPKYPPIAVTARAYGNVVVEVQIDAAGRVILAQALKGHPLLRKAAEDAARDWKFVAATEAAPVRRAQLTFTFQIVRGETDEKRLVSPVFFSPYHVAIKRASPVIYFDSSDRMVIR